MNNLGWTTMCMGSSVALLRTLEFLPLYLCSMFFAFNQQPERVYPDSPSPRPFEEQLMTCWNWTTQYNNYVWANLLIETFSHFFGLLLLYIPLTVYFYFHEQPGWRRTRWSEHVSVWGNHRRAPRRDYSAVPLCLWLFLTTNGLSGCKIFAMLFQELNFRGSKVERPSLNGRICLGEHSSSNSSFSSYAFWFTVLCVSLSYNSYPGQR